MNDELEKEDALDKYVDYKDLYFRMMRVTTKAINMLVAAQQACEEAYISAVDKELDGGEDEAARRFQELAAGEADAMEDENWSCYLD